MTNEIKEIIEEMKYFKEHYKDFNGCTVTLEHNGEQITQIYDYITNLQEENERLKEERQNINNRNCNQRMANKKLMEDIERLRTNLKTHKRRRKKQTHKKNIYKSRNEKAIEYIEKHTNHFVLGANREVDEFDYISTSPKALLNILKGEDE